MSKIKNISSGFIGQAVTVLSQLALVPFFFHSWGADYYGQWLQIVAVPYLLAFGDFGFAAVFSNKLNEAKSKGYQLPLISRTFTTGIIFALAISLLVALISSSWYLFVDENLLDGRYLLVAFLMGVYAISSILTTYCINSSRSFDQYHIFLNYFNIARIFEFLVVVGLLYSNFSAVIVALSYMFVRIVVMVFVMYRAMSELGVSLKHGILDFNLVDLSTFKRTVPASLLPLSLMLSLQIPLLLVANFFGNSSVATFSTMRTLARLPLQYVNVINSSFWGDISRLYYTGKFLELDRGLYFHLFLSLGGGCVLSLILYAVGDEIYRMWTAIKMPSPSLFFVLLLSTIVTSSWLSLSLIYSSTNRHGLFSYFYILVLLLCCGYLAFGGVASIDEVAWILLVAEVLTVLRVLYVRVRVGAKR